MDNFLPFQPPRPNNPHNQNLEKKKKAFEDVIILNLCIKKSRSYDVSLLIICRACTDIIFLFFALLAHYWPQKLKFGKIVKKHLEILSFYTCVPSINQADDAWFLRYDAWFLRYEIQQTEFFFVILGNSNTLKNENIKHENTPGDIIILHKCTTNHVILFLRYGSCRM